MLMAHTNVIEKDSIGICLKVLLFGFATIVSKFLNYQKLIAAGEMRRRIPEFFEEIADCIF